MDINTISTLIERIGLPAVVIIGGGFLFWRSQTQSYTLLSRQTNILDAMRRSNEDVSKSTNPIPQTLARLELKIDDLPTPEHLKGLVKEIGSQLDTHRDSYFDKFGMLLNAVSAVNEVLTSLKKMSEDGHKVQMETINSIADVTKKLPSVIELAMANIQKEVKHETNHIAVDPMLASGD